MLAGGACDAQAEAMAQAKRRRESAKRLKAAQSIHDSLADGMGLSPEERIAIEMAWRELSLAAKGIVPPADGPAGIDDARLAMIPRSWQWTERDWTKCCKAIPWFPMAFRYLDFQESQARASGNHAEAMHWIGRAVQFTRWIEATISDKVGAPQKPARWHGPTDERRVSVPTVRDLVNMLRPGPEKLPADDGKWHNEHGIRIPASTDYPPAMPAEIYAMLQWCQ